MQDRHKIYKSNINMEKLSSPRVIAINYISPNSTVLDVGCACGDLGAALKQHKNATMFGIDYNKESLDIAEQTGCFEGLRQADLDLIKEGDYPEFNQKFDYIIFGDVLEHLRFPKNILKLFSKYLKPNGSFITSIPNIAHTSIKSNLLLNDFTYTSVGLLDETHIHFFTYKSIAQDFADIGIKIGECQFTIKGIYGWQPNHAYPLLSADTKKLLFDDYHSFVCQYVVKATLSEENPERLLEENLKALDINDDNAPDYIKEYRAKALSKVKKTNKEKVISLKKKLQATQLLLESKEEELQALKAAMAQKP